MARSFAAREPATSEAQAMLVGVCGPPGAGKTYSALRMATGMKRVHGGPIVVIDTEGGRAAKYHLKRGGIFDFLHVDFQPPCRPSDFLAAINEQLAHKPSAIIVDSLSDEHEGQGGVIDWHDELVPTMRGNEWGAWNKPKADRKKLIAGILQIKTPLLFTFRAREKTVQEGSKVKNVGFMPVAPAEITGSLDLLCLLPPKSDGHPIWQSAKAGEDFTIKLPRYLRPFIDEQKALDEDMGAAFARWARGDAQGVAGSPPLRQANEASATPSATPSASPLADRVHAVVLALNAAADEAAVDRLWKRAEPLRNDLAAKDPEGLAVTLTSAHQERVTALFGEPVY